MKKITATMIICLLVTGSLCAQYQDNSNIYKDKTAVVIKEDDNEGKKIFILQTSKRDRLYWGPDIFWTNESPHIKNIHVKDNSVYYGLKVGYDFLRPNAIYAGADILYALGRMHIRADADKTKVYKEHVNGAFARAEMRVGYNFHGRQPFYFSPYFGLGGYHVRPTHSIHYVQNWLYAAIGAKIDYEVSPYFNIGFNLKGTRALYLEQRVKKHTYSASRHNNGNVLGYELSLPVTFRMGQTQDWDLRLEPYYLKLNSQSDANVVGGQLTFSSRF